MADTITEEVEAGQVADRARLPWWWAGAAFVLVGAVVWLVAYVAGTVLPREYLYPRLDDLWGGAAVERWVRWDSMWYRDIVRHGYVYLPDVQSSVAFFPAYPLVVAALSRVLPGVLLAGVVVTAVSGLAGALVFQRWCAERLDARATATAVMVLLVYPYAWYLYGAVYSDALFLVTAVAAFVLVERRRYWAAGLLGTLAVAGRPTGIAVAIGLVLVVLERETAARSTGADEVDADASSPDGATARRSLPVRAWRALDRRFDSRSWPRSAWPVLISFGGLAAWMGYLWVRFGDPLLFVHIESEWKQGAGPATWLKFRFFQEIPNMPVSIFSSGLLLHAAAGLGALALVPAVARRIGWSYAAYVLIVMGIPVIGTKDFMSTGRYAIAAFPCFAVIGAWLATRPTKAATRWWLGVSATLLVLGTVFWTMGKYVA